MTAARPGAAPLPSGAGPKLGPETFQPHEILIAVLAAVAVQAGAGLALRATALEKPAAMPEIDRGAAVPVKVVPVLDMDSPLLKLGGRKQPLKLPDQWVRQEAVKRVEQKAFVSPKAGKTEKDIPPPEVKIADAGTPPPPPDAAVAKVVDTPLDYEPDASAPSNVDTEGHADGVKEGTETDPLKARAVDIYRARIAGWFSGRFRVSGSGLPPEEMTKYRVQATVQLSDRRVVGYSISSSGNAAFDAAARATLEGAKGDTIPPPPENYPDIAPSSISVTFICKEGRCD